MSSIKMNNVANDDYWDIVQETLKKTDILKKPEIIHNVTRNQLLDVQVRDPYWQERAATPSYIYKMVQALRKRGIKAGYSPK